MKKIYLLIIGLVIVAGGVITWQNTANKKGSSSDSKSTASSSTPSKTLTAQEQYESYKGKTYDRMFLAGMMAHHQGAIDMANLALTNAKHQEIKDLANAIITAQTSEIASMTDWQKEWNYPATSGAAMQDHSAMVMDNEMSSMTKELKSKTGDEFDRTFLTQMIAHHQEAIDMSKPAAANAQHQEIKDLAKSIIAAQTSEIAKMRSWQTAWSSTAPTDNRDSMSGMHM